MLPRTSACLDAALDPLGFEDIADLGDEWQDAINCIAYYGVTVGRTPTTYDPDSEVTRMQMALFLHRAATAAGVDFTPAADDPVAMFTDTDGLGDVWLEAIGDLYGKGIMTGAQPQRQRCCWFTEFGDLRPRRADQPCRDGDLPPPPLCGFASPGLFDSDGDLEGVESSRPV